MNKIIVAGYLTRGDTARCKFDVKYNEMYSYTLDVVRKSGTVDKLLVLSPDKDLPEGGVHIEGKLYAEYIHGIGVPVVVLPDVVESTEDAYGHSGTEITGKLRKKPKSRMTKRGLAITSILVFTEGGPVPVVLWGGNATKAENNFNAGDSIKIVGRLQSRKYINRKNVLHITYELSARGIESFEEGE